MAVFGFESHHEFTQEDLNRALGMRLHAGAFRIPTHQGREGAIGFSARDCGWMSFHTLDFELFLKRLHVL